MIEIREWDDIALETDIGIAAALELLNADVQGQVVIHVADGKVVFTAVELAGDVLFFGKHVSNDGKTTNYDSPAITQNYDRAAAKWNQRHIDKFPPLKDFLFESWEDMIKQITP